VEYLEYLDGLSLHGIKYHHYWLVVIIIAAWYCESRNEKYIRFNALKVKCNEALKRLTKGEIIPDGSFASIIHSGKYRKFFTVKQVQVKSKKGTWVTETWIRPHIPEIQQEIKSRKIENLDNGDERLVHLRKGESIPRIKSPKEIEVVRVSESLTRQTTKTRSPDVESVQVSDRVGITVVHADQKKGAKRHKHISGV
jgi:hypothetical protein